MTEPIIVRASQVDVVERCNGAAYGLSVQGESDPSATEGTLVHAALARYAIARRDGIALDQDSFDLPGDAQMLFERGAAFIDKLNLTGARIERRMEATMFGIHWSAQPDLVTDYQHIIDHKCDLDPESTHHGQMKMAAFLDHVRVHSNPDLTRYLPPKWRCTTVYLRDDSADDGYYTPAELWAWAEALAAKVHSPIAYTIGAHCRYCAKRVGCPGHTASLTTLVATPEGTLVSDDDLVRIYPLLTQYEA
ncbi:MAG: hypothetical protein IMZ50_08710, partial [Candidatus Atribacteria bacterium]|nr:hypothetical protein [Candidatus Atribacteria bacterium]